jgi:hypothetical protein
MEQYNSRIRKSAGRILAFALQLRKKHGKTSVRVPDENRIYRIEYT